MSHAPSKVAIGNLALSHVGARSTIESFDETRSAEAKQIKAWYDFAREAVLEAFDWSFARGRQILAEHSEDPPEGIWVYRYQYPSNCVILRSLQNPLGPDADPVPYEIELQEDGQVKTVLTNLEDAVAIYTRNIETTTLFSAHFVLTLSRKLASLIAFSLTAKTKVAAENEGQYQLLILVAPAHNANEEQASLPRDADTIRARL